MSYTVAGTVEIPSGRNLVVEELELRKGVVTFVRGPSGCGKTSLFKKLCGSTSYGGSLAVSPPIDRLAFITHDSTLVPWLSLEGNLRLEAKMRRTAPPLDDFVCRLARMGLTTLDQRCGSLSLGMRQRVEIARMLCFQPAVMILDEAWSGVDARWRTTVFEVLDEYANQSGACLLAATHADFDVLRFGDELYAFDINGISMPAVTTGLPRAARLTKSARQLWQAPELEQMIAFIEGAGTL